MPIMLNIGFLYNSVSYHQHVQIFNKKINNLNIAFLQITKKFESRKPFVTQDYKMPMIMNKYIALTKACATNIVVHVIFTVLKIIFG